MKGLLERHRQILWERSEEGQKAIKIQENLKAIQQWLNDNNLQYTVENTNGKLIFRDKQGNPVEFHKIVAENMSK